MAEDTSLQTQFFQEALDILSNAEEIVLQLEQHGSDQDQVHSLFRLFHTLKGNSNMVGEEEINLLTHALESEYDQVRNGKRRLEDSLLQLTFEVIDILNAAAQEGDSSDYVPQMQNLVRQLSETSRGGPAPEGPAPEEVEASKATETIELDQEKSPEPSRQVAEKEGPVEEKSSAASRVPASQPENQIGFSTWKPVIRSFYRCEERAQKLKSSKQDLPELLMDLGMEAIDLRSNTDEMNNSAVSLISQIAVYLEKFTATLAREQFPYNDISYELLFVLCEDFKKALWKQLYFTGALAYKKIATMEELNRIEEEVPEGDKLWIIDLAFASSNSTRSSDFFSRMIQIKRSIHVPLVYISPLSHYYRKAADLLDQALGGFTRIAATIEDGVKMYILSEE